MKILLLFGFLSSALFAKSQSADFELIKEIHSNWKKLNPKNSNKCEIFFYSDSIDNYPIEIVENELLLNSTFLKFSLNKDTTNAERIHFDSLEVKYIINRLHTINSELWPDSIFPNSKLIPFNKIDSIQKSINDKKLDPLLRLCYSVHIFSHPIFLRKNTICLFFSGKTNFAVKEGEVWIYKKEGLHWKKYSPIYRWIE